MVTEDITDNNRDGGKSLTPKGILDLRQTTLTASGRVINALNIVARIENATAFGKKGVAQTAPDYAALHPGYTCRFLCYAASCGGNQLYQTQNN